MSFFERIFGKKESSRDSAKKRLKHVLVHDRSSLSPRLIEIIKEEILQVIRKYVEIDDACTEMTFDENGEQAALIANIFGLDYSPIMSIILLLVIGIALQFIGVLRSGTINSANKINETLTEKTTCELDEEAPVITFINGTCAGNKTTIEIRATDDCGIDIERIGFYANSENGNGTWVKLSLKNGTITDGYWTGTASNSTLYADGNNVTGVVVAFDKTHTANEKIESFALSNSCSI
jgi:cell division topological specificity factor